VSKHYAATWDTLAIGASRLRPALVALHLKAFPTDPRSCAQREAQARIARWLVADLAANGARRCRVAVCATCRAADAFLHSTRHAQPQLAMTVDSTLLSDVSHHVAGPVRLCMAVSLDITASTTYTCAGYEVIVPGGLNVFTASVPDAANSEPTPIVLAILTDESSSDGGPLLQNVVQRVPRAECYAAWYNRNRW
jgi:hypothetical protein